MLTLLPSVARYWRENSDAVRWYWQGRTAARSWPRAPSNLTFGVPNHNTGQHPYGRLRHLFLATGVWVFKPPWQSNSPT